MSGETLGKIIATAGTCIGAIAGLTGFIISAADKASKAAAQTEEVRRMIREELPKFNNLDH
ncbi:MAG: hypothetical protein J6Y02_16355 [Pseudobutyrivibrio sp.]|nr:hypothetical protein [Pseudobutyrivibrio sp.]